MLDVATFLKKNILEILEDARFAPSVHNTQPWKVSVEEDVILVSIDQDNILAPGDPTGRQTFISLGIFCEAIINCAGVKGLQEQSVQIHNDCIRISFKPSLSLQKTSGDIIKLLHSRSSDRSIYSPTSINQKNLEKIKNSSPIDGVKVWYSDEIATINQVAQLTSKGIGVAISSPEFRKELSSYLILPGSKSKRGISVKSLYIPYFLSLVEPLLIKYGLGLGAEVKLEKKRWESASALFFITTRGDLPEYWLLAGRVYLRVSLAIEELGLSQATSAATVEASTFHEDVESILSTNERLQTVIRVGKGSSKRFYSPRVSAESLLTT